MKSEGMSELKRCPFCGGGADYIQILGNYERPHEVYCFTCDGGITEGRSKDGVIHNWNTRPIEDELRKRIAELSQAVGLITTLKPTMVMDTEHPLDMAKEVVEYVTVRIAELEAEQARWVMVSERLPIKSGWYLAGLIGWAGGYYTAEVNFDAETGLPWRSSVRDEVFCWLDGVPELPQPPEVQE